MTCTYTDQITLSLSRSLCLHGCHWLRRIPTDSQRKPLRITRTRFLYRPHHLPDAQCHNTELYVLHKILEENCPLIIFV